MRSLVFRLVAPGLLLVVLLGVGLVLGNEALREFSSANDLLQHEYEEVVHWSAISAAGARCELALHRPLAPGGRLALGQELMNAVRAFTAEVASTGHPEDPGHLHAEEAIAAALLKGARAVQAAAPASDPTEFNRACAAFVAHLGERDAEFRTIEEAPLRTSRVESPRHAVDRHARIFRWAGAGGLILALAMLLTSLHATSRIRRIGRRAQRIGAGQTEPETPLAGRDELGGLSHEVEQMAASLWRSDQDLRARLDTTGKMLAHSDRLATLGRVASGIAHEVNNPLATATAAVDAMRDRVREPDEPLDRVFFLAYLEKVLASVARVQAFIHQFLDVARPSSEAHASVDLGAACAEAASLAGASVDAVGHELTFDRPAEPLTVMGDRRQLVQVLMNVLLNALQASAPGGAVRIALAPSGDTARISIRDEGCGFSASEGAQLFEPFHTTRTAQGGVGLGLALAQNLVEAHQGRIQARSGGAGAGAEFVIELPMAQPEVG